MQDESVSSSSEEAIRLKELGNEAYRSGDYSKALELFTNALNVDPTLSQLYCNRSMCHGALLNWEASIRDARQAIQLTDNYEKAWFRLVKGLLEIGKYREAGQNLLLAYVKCPDSKVLSSLEKEYFLKSGVHLRPKPHEFDVRIELGDGNFSKIFQATFKPTGLMYAIKVIDKATVSKMKKRHPNIDNEILMEKRALNRLEHPLVVTLYATFQDYGSLYYQMEYLSGGELWKTLHDSLVDSVEYPVGCYPSLALFYVAECIFALEYIHRQGIVHRDIKPENIMLTANGHIKLVDFGTAKDLIQTDLNGPEFVGTAEYMSPLTVKSQWCGPEADLWALGVVLFQLMFGYTAFAASSPYLTFLRIKKASIRTPRYASAQLRELLSTLLTKDARSRLQLCTGQSDLIVNAIDSTSCRRISYQKLLSFDAFNPLRDRLNLAQDESIPDLVSRPALRVPTLKELCLRAVGHAAVAVANETANAGGIRPSIRWLKNFDLLRLTDTDRWYVGHYLSRHGRMHVPGINRLFWPNAVDARCCRADAATREYTGYSRTNNSVWSNDFIFSTIPEPNLSNDQTAEINTDALRRAISAVNKLRPKFVVINGNFTVYHPLHERFEAAIQLFRRTMARVSDTIPVLFVPGVNDVGIQPTPESIGRYTTWFGADYYGFWYQGLRCLIINSPLMVHPELSPLQSRLQDEWLSEEIQQAKLCASNIVIFSYHIWQDSTPHSERGMPQKLLDKWLGYFRHSKVQLVITASKSGDCTMSDFLFSKREGKRRTRVEHTPIDLETEPRLPSQIIAEESGQEHNDADSSSEDENEVSLGVDPTDKTNDKSLPAVASVDVNESDDEQTFLNSDERCQGPQLTSIASLTSSETRLGIVAVSEDECFIRLCPEPEWAALTAQTTI